MSINDYDKSIGISPTNAIEFDDYRNHLIRSATQINTYKQLPTLSIKVVSPPVKTNLDFQLKNLSIGQGATARNSNTSTSNLMNIPTQVMFRGRIVGNNFFSPHQLLKDPCDVASFKGDAKRLLGLINQHMLCISKEGASGLEGLQIGDIVTVSKPVGDVGSISLQFCYFNEIESRVPSDEVLLKRNKIEDSCESLVDLFERNGFNSNIDFINQYPPITWNLQAGENINEFYEKLKNSPQFAGFSDNFLWGLTANAFAESGLVSNIGGDPESRIGKRDYAPVKNYCSFGYWQLQLCAIGAEGTELLRTFSPAIYERHIATANTNPREELPDDLQEGILNLITAEHIQFAWVSKRMKELFPSDWNNSAITPARAAELITIKFEKPEDKEVKGKLRGDSAERMKTQYQNSSSTT